MKRVLIVDGDMDSRTVYRIMLQHHGYEVDEVEDGERALVAAQSGSYSAIVMELTLRLVDGYTLLSRLKSDPRTASVCVVVLTARALPEDRERASQAGCATFLTKPAEPQLLAREINLLLEQTR